MKKIFSILIICLVFAVSGCDSSHNSSQKPGIIMSSKIINSETAANPETRFKPGQKINYAIVSPNGFKDNVLRVQILKKSTSVTLGGYDIVMARNIPINAANKYHIDYFTLPNPGYYLMRVFEIRDLENQIAIYDFFIQ